MFNIQTGIIAVALGGLIFYLTTSKRNKQAKTSKEQSFLTRPLKKKQKTNKTLLDTFEMV